MQNSRTSTKSTTEQALAEWLGKSSGNEQFTALLIVELLKTEGKLKTIVEDALRSWAAELERGEIEISGDDDEALSLWRTLTEATT